MCFELLEVKFIDEVQRKYEIIRPVILFEDKTVLERSQQTKVHHKAIQKYIRRFEKSGMKGFFNPKEFSTVSSSPP